MAAGSSDFFMCDQAWNCWLMQIMRTNVPIHTFRKPGANPERASHTALKGTAGLNTWKTREQLCCSRTCIVACGILPQGRLTFSRGSPWIGKWVQILLYQRSTLCNHEKLLPIVVDGYRKGTPIQCFDSSLLRIFHDIPAWNLKHGELTTRFKLCTGISLLMCFPSKVG